MAIDASLIEADASKQNSTSKEDCDAAIIDPADAPRAVREYLDTLDEAAFAPNSEQLFLRSQTGVLPQNRRLPDFRRAMHTLIIQS